MASTSRALFVASMAIFVLMSTLASAEVPRAPRKLLADSGSTKVNVDYAGSTKVNVDVPFTTVRARANNSATADTADTTTANSGSRTTVQTPSASVATDDQGGTAVRVPIVGLKVDTSGRRRLMESDGSTNVNVDAPYTAVRVRAPTASGDASSTNTATATADGESRTTVQTPWTSVVYDSEGGTAVRVPIAGVKVDAPGRRRLMGGGATNVDVRGAARVNVGGGSQVVNTPWANLVTSDQGGTIVRVPIAGVNVDVSGRRRLADVLVNTPWAAVQQGPGATAVEVPVAGVVVDAP